MMTRAVMMGALLLGLAGSASGVESLYPKEGEVDFEKHVRPILEAACVNCHGEKEQEGRVALHERARLDREAGEFGQILTPGDPDESSMWVTCTLEADDPLLMPPAKEGPLSAGQIEVLRLWIEAGAEWPEGVVLTPQPRMRFEEHIQPILEQNCVSCHNPEEDKGGLDLSTKEKAFTGGEGGMSLVPFSPDESDSYYLCTLDPDDADLMPPSNAGGPLSEEEIDKLRLWILQGAVWPDGLVLEAKEKVVGTDSPDNLELVRQIREFILETTEKEGWATEEGAMEAYEAEIPLTGVAYRMAAIPGGEFVMGSGDDDPDRKEDEAQVRVVISPFWMGVTEVTWDEYEPFMVTDVERHKDGSRKQLPDEPSLVELVSQPTTPYTEMSFGMGTAGYPALNMTQHAASKFCQWLSAQTGRYYRLATEAEWEYACRAGTTTRYHFGDDAAGLGEYAWYFENSNYQYQKVGQKKANPWGLHDMHGNVAEWVLDRYDPEGYGGIEDGAKNPWVRASELHPRSVRGGHWDHDPQDLRSAARMGSRPEWRATDPQLPQSIWYETDPRWLGFRIVRPLEVPSAEEMYEMWNSAAGLK